MAKFGRLGLIRAYFSKGKHGRKCTMSELKALTPEDKEELGKQVVPATNAKATGQDGDGNPNQWELDESTIE